MGVDTRTEPALAPVGASPSADSTSRTLLLCGVVAGPFYLALGIAQALVRDGFDLARHPLSVLANGPGGWIQTANFVLTALMVIAAAMGIRRVLAPDASVASWFLGGFAAGMIVAAVFPADPVDGFPPGTPAGFPTSISTPGLIHFIAGALGFVSLAVSCLLTARVMSRHAHTLLARFSLACGLVVLLGFFSGPVLGGGTLGIWISVVVGWGWLTAVSLHLIRVSPAANGARRSRSGS